MALPTTVRPLSSAPLSGSMDTGDQYLILKAGVVQRVDYLTGQGPAGATGPQGASFGEINLGVMVDGAIGSSQLILPKYLFARAFDFAANLAGSVGRLDTAPTSEMVFDIQKNGGSVGSMTFAAAANLATFSSSAFPMAIGDYLEVVAPVSVDATAADLSMTLVANVP